MQVIVGLRNRGVVSVLWVDDFGIEFEVSSDIFKHDESVNHVDSVVVEGAQFSLSTSSIGSESYAISQIDNTVEVVSWKLDFHCFIFVVWVSIEDEADSSISNIVVLALLFEDFFGN